MPPLNLNTLIDSNDIVSIKNLSPNRPVFLVIGDANSRLVIKQEVTPFAHDPINLKFANKAMGAVSLAAQSKVLSQFEVAELGEVVRLETYIAQVTFKPVPADIAYLAHTLGQGGSWFKMREAADVLELKVAIANSMNNQDKSGVRQFTTALSAPNGLESLGKILAADIFSGNTDRFNVGDDGNGGTGLPNPRGGRFQVLVNVSNVLLSTQHGAAQPLGLDAYEVMGEFRHLDQTIAALEAQSGHTWPGRRLGGTVPDATWRHQFAAMCIADLEAALGPRNRKIAWGSTNRLPSNAALRLVAGINTGRTEIQAKLAPWRNKATCPVGLVDRLNILGW